MRDQHQISLALVNEVRNLRSTVSRSAIFAIGELFAKLKSQIEPVCEWENIFYFCKLTKILNKKEIDILTQSLLNKVGENSIFIREDIDHAINQMVESMPQTRAAVSLVTYGSK